MPINIDRKAIFVNPSSKNFIRIKPEAINAIAVLKYASMVLSLAR